MKIKIFLAPLRFGAKFISLFPLRRCGLVCFLVTEMFLKQGGEAARSTALREQRAKLTLP